ncbi:VirC2 family conjugal transfer protein [Amaricoccus macauensis]|uniref:VirC2 family conjugal transfer protein n=1 Tax=Amaricoccus macauensis TaxID=57001 RepID=UPI001FE7E5D1|nr:VirC2 family conjugal transfer protein [Amaricoccus macauensis]
MKRGLPLPAEAPEEPAAAPPTAAPEPQADRKARPQPVTRKARPPRAAPTRSPAEDSEGTVPVKLRVPAPKPGAFPLFDQAAASMGEKRALQRLLSRSLSDLADAVERGERISPATYPAGKVSLNTTKMLSPGLYAAAKAALDPLDLETPGGLGRAISMAALARYLERGIRVSAGHAPTLPAANEEG